MTGSPTNAAEAGRADGARIVVRDVSKRYVKFDDTPTLVGRALQLRNRAHRSDLWALQDISFSAAPGECVGFVGRNGAGKSTLLRLLAGVTAPTKGSVTVRGQVAPLIAVGVGFHPELTGRENVYLSSAILGRDRSGTDARFDEIVAFADIGDFLDTPVKFYSSGMFVRLGFAVAVSLQPEVLLVDEVLAVGDIGFQQRCFGRIDELREAGTTIVLVSHNLQAVNRLCDRTGVLHRSRLAYMGDTSTAITTYHDLLASDGTDDGAGAALTRIDAGLWNDEDRPLGTVTAGDRVAVSLTARCEQPVQGAIVTMVVTTTAGVMAYGHSSRWDQPASLAEGDHLRCRITFDARLVPGTYEVHVGVVGTDGQHLLPMAPVASFFVTAPERARGVADLAAHFDIDRP